MEVNSVQTQTSVFTPLEDPAETETPAPATNERNNTQSVQRSDAVQVDISDEARAEAENEQLAAEEERTAETPSNEPEVVQAYTNAGRIAG